MSEDVCHAAGATVAVPADAAFAYLADGLNQSDWALGSWDRRDLGDGLFVGRSLFDGSELYVRLRADPAHLTVDYAIGRDPGALRRVNSARVVPGPELGRPAGTCVVTLLKWRVEGQSDDQWRMACSTFSTEIHMIKGRLERPSAWAARSQREERQSLMPPDDPNAHSASIHVAAPPERAFAFLADGMCQTHWALGSWDRRDLGDGLYAGTSLFDGSELFVRLTSHAELGLVDYHVGTSPDQLRPLVEARVVRGAVLGRDPASCVVTLTIWRAEGTPEEAWRRTYHAFRTEVHLIKGRLEREHRR